MCKNLRGQHPLRVKIESPGKSPVGCVSMRTYNFFVCGPKFKFLTPHVGGVVVDHLLFRVSLC